MVNLTERAMKLLILIATILFTSQVNAATEKTTKSKIERVTVFLRGAEVHRTANSVLSTGMNIIIFDNLESGIDPKSIQASGTGSFTILDVKHKVKYPEESRTLKFSKHEKEIKLLEDSLLNLDYDLEANANKKDVLSTERNLLLNNKLIKGETKNDTLPQIKDALLFFREKLNNINAELLKLKKEYNQLTTKRNRIQINLNELRAFEQQSGSLQKPTTSYQVQLTIATETAGNATFQVSYYLGSAGWTPSYDLRTTSANATMKLTYKAHVYQSTGVDWDDIRLTLSTGSPKSSNHRPVLSPYYINYFQSYKKYKSRAATKDLEMSMAEEVMQNAPASVAKEDKAMTAAEFTIAEETMTNFEYNIKLSYQIPSDGQTHIVAIQNKEIPASYEHFAIPKLDNNAFTLAKLSGWDDLNLIAGSANLFFDGSYVGETFIDPTTTNDTLELSVGRDKSIVLKRVRMKDKTRERILADEKKQTVSYEVTVRNTKSIASTMTIEDQIPVSSIKEIAVELKESSGAHLDPANGKLTWKINLKPKETKKFIVTYEVTYPKDRVLSIL